jgi:ribonuclease VapC
VLPFGENEASIARYVFGAFGKGRHPAGLNFGDSLSYATSGSYNDALLYKGDDFSLTPIHSALDATT